MAEGPQDPIEELLPAYALNALEPEERDLVERALEREPRYQAMLDGYLETVAQLAGLHPRVIPARDGGDPVLARVRSAIASGSQDESAGTSPAERSARRRGGPPGPFWGIAAALAIAVLGLGIFSVVQQRRVDHLEEEMVTLAAEAAETEQKLQEHREVTAWAAQPNATLAAMRALDEPVPADRPAMGILVPKPDGGYVLMTLNLPPLDDESTYQVWLWETEDEVISVARFDVDETGYALVSIELPSRSAESKWLSVNVEQAGGSMGPTGTAVLVGFTQPAQ